MARARMLESGMSLGSKCELWLTSRMRSGSSDFWMYLTMVKVSPPASKERRWIWPQRMLSRDRANFLYMMVSPLLRSGVIDSPLT